MWSCVDRVVVVIVVLRVSGTLPEPRRQFYARRDSCRPPFIRAAQVRPSSGEPDIVVA